MKAKIHYAISDRPSSSICGRFSENTTRIVGRETCKDCRRELESNNYSVAQFVRRQRCAGCGQAMAYKDGVCYCKNAFCSVPPVPKPDIELVAPYFNFSPVLGLTDDEMLPPFFSKLACQTCGCTEHGDRYYCSATVGKAHKNLRERLEICVDCFQYFFT